MPEPVNRQGGVPIGDGQTEVGESVAHGDRRDEVRYEDDPAQLARVRHTFHRSVLPHDMHTSRPDGDAADIADVTDAEEVKPSPSVWDARPPDA